jgi:hypothetical protein
MNVSRAIVKEANRLNEIFYHDPNTKTAQHIIKPVGFYGNYEIEEVYIISCSHCGTSIISKDEKNTDYNPEDELCAKCTSSILKDVHQKALTYWKKELKKSKKKLKKKLAQINKTNKRNSELSHHVQLISNSNPNKWGEPIELETDSRQELELDWSGYIDWRRGVDITVDKVTGVYVIKPVETELELEGCHE